MNYLNQQIKNNLLSGKITILVIMMFVFGFFNLKFGLISPENLHFLILVIYGFSVFVLIGFYMFLFRGYLRKDIFLFYEHYSFFIGSMLPIVLIVIFIILLENERDQNAYFFMISAIMLLFTIIRLQGFSFVEFASDSVFIKNGKDRRIFNFRNEEIIEINSIEKLIIKFEDQEVSIKKNIIIEYSKGDLVKQLKSRIGALTV